MKHDLGDVVWIDVENAKERGKFKKLPSDYGIVEAEIVEVECAHDYRVSLITPQHEGYHQYINRNCITSLCSRCNQRKIFHDTEDRYFCPWCEK